MNHAFLLLLFKRTITLFVLVEPISMIPVFLSSVRGCSLPLRRYYARSIGIAVTLSLLTASLAGGLVLNLLSISIPAMQVGGAVIMGLLAIAMVMGKESSFKGSYLARPDDAGTSSGAVIHNSPGHRSPVAHPVSIVPLAIPLLAGPASFSYVISNGWQVRDGLVITLVPVLIVGASCWLVYYLASSADHEANRVTLDLVERISGFLLISMSADLLATGLRALFPGLA